MPLPLMCGKDVISCANGKEIISWFSKDLYTLDNAEISSHIS